MSRSKRGMTCLVVIALIPLMGQTGPCDMTDPAASLVPGPEGPEGPQGPAGETGATGEQGSPGADGADGVHCWDTNGNGLADAAEDTNGDGTVDVLDCMTDSVGCEACDERFVNEGQDASITTAMIADQAVTLNKLESAGAAEGAVLTMSGAGATWQLPANEKPFVVFAENGSVSQISSSWGGMLVVVVEAPTSGKVHVIGNASLTIRAAGDAQGEMGIAHTTTLAPAGGVARLRREGCEVRTVSATAQAVFDVEAGMHSFYLVGRALGVPWSVLEYEWPQMSATFYPD